MAPRPATWSSSARRRRCTSGAESRSALAPMARPRGDGARHAWQDRRMDETFGIESPPRHHEGSHRPPVRYLVIIDEAGSAVARLFLASREQVGEVDAGSEELAGLVRGRVPD